MNTFSRVFLLGNLTRDPSIRFTPNGSLICEFTVALRSRKMQDGEAKDAAEFIPVNAWDKLGRLCFDKLVKGSAVHVEGHLKPNRWLDRKTGERHSRLVVTARDVSFIARLREGPPPGMLPQAEAAS